MAPPYPARAALAPSRLPRPWGRWVPWLLCMALLLAPAAVSAQAWLRLDRVETTPSVFEGHTRLRLYVGAIELYGKRIELGATDFKLKLGSSDLRAPALLTTFEGAGDALAIGLVVATTSDYLESFAELRGHLRAFVEALPRDAQLAVVGYSEDLTGGHRVAEQPQALKQLDRLDAELVDSPPDLLGAVERVLRAVKRAKPPVEGQRLRRMIIVVSDGKDGDPAPERYRRVAKLSSREDIPIHSVAYSPQNHRRPMLGLGELSKRSNGTFRLILTLPGAKAQLDNLLAEINQQYVLTYYLPNGAADGKRVRLYAKDLESNEGKALAPVCGEATCQSDQYCVAARCVAFARDGGRGILGWVLLLGGIAAGLLVIVLAVGFVLSRRMASREIHYSMPHPAHPAAAHHPATAPASGDSSHRIVGMAPGQQPGQAAVNAYGGLPTAGAVPAAGAAAPAAAPPTGPHAVAGLNPYGGAPTPGAVSVAGGRPAAAQPPHGLAPRASMLYVLSGPYQGRQLPVRHGFLMGKAPGCDLDLSADGYASTHHAHLVVDTAGNVTVVDRGSTNGTFVNGVRVSQMQLGHGMVIRVGSTDVRFLSQ